MATERAWHQPVVHFPCVNLSIRWSAHLSIVRLRSLSYRKHFFLSEGRHPLQKFLCHVPVWSHVRSQKFHEVSSNSQFLLAPYTQNHSCGLLVPFRIRLFVFLLSCCIIFTTCLLSECTWSHLKQHTNIPNRKWVTQTTIFIIKVRKTLLRRTALPHTLRSFVYPSIF